MCKACHGCIRVMMMIFNFIFVLIGLGLLGAGLYFYLWTFIKDMGNDGTTMVISFYILMGIGAFTLIVGACGCCGAFHESPCLLGTYFVLLLIIFAAEVTGAVLCIIFRKEAESIFDKTFDKGIKEMPKSKHWMNQVQEMLKCCGSNSGLDYVSAEGLKLPGSCCSDGKCTGISSVTSITRPGCKAAWKDFIQRYWMIFAGVLLAVALIELIGLIFSMCLCCTARTIEYDMVETRA